MAERPLSKKVLKQIDDAVAFYEPLRMDFDRLGRTLLMLLAEDARLIPLVHSAKFRTKEASHLRLKLHLIAAATRGDKDAVPITKGNLLSKVTDLVGVRLLHLYSRQLGSIRDAIGEILAENHYVCEEGPIGITWDVVTKGFLEGLGIQAELRESMYTSVHYVLTSAARPEMRIELQVRTLMDEVWGEVSHTVDYPHGIANDSCKEQLRALACITSGGTRVVDAIFLTHEAHLAANANLPSAD